MVVLLCSASESYPKSRSWSNRGAGSAKEQAHRSGGLARQSHQRYDARHVGAFLYRTFGILSGQLMVDARASGAERNPRIQFYDLALMHHSHHLERFIL
jgi:hypothetical protein